ncbi:MAG: hypothetical protein Q9221_002357 [Calogaya cf. arnoldii]
MMENNHVPAPSASGKQDEDSDWEYEYHETETESFYVTVDVSSASQHSKGSKRGDLLFPVNANPEPSKRIPIDPALQDGSPASQPPSEKPQDQGPRDRIQILDLHTRNPLISYDDRIFSCNWASTIGTDIFLASPDSLSSTTVDGGKVTPIYKAPNVSVIGTSSINLTARPVTVTAWHDASQPQTTPANPTTETPTVLTPRNPDPDPSQPSSETNPTHPPLAPSSPTQTQPPKIPISYDASNNSRAQASFLESLMAIKASKGETDQVTVHATKQNHGTGWRVQRRLAEEQERLALLDDDNSVSDTHSDDDDDDEDEEAMDLTYSDLPSMRSAETQFPATASAAEDAEDEQQAGTTRGLTSPRKRESGRSRARRGTGRVRRATKTTYRRKGVKVGGLFRDYVPDAGDTVGADIRAGGESTPRRWEEVEGVRRDEGSAVGGIGEDDAVGGVGEGDGARGGGHGDEDVRMEDVG